MGGPPHREVVRPSEVADDRNGLLRLTRRLPRVFLEAQAAVEDTAEESQALSRLRQALERRLSLPEGEEFRLRRVETEALRPKRALGLPEGGLRAPKGLFSRFSRGQEAEVINVRADPYPGLAPHRVGYHQGRQDRRPRRPLR